MENLCRQPVRIRSFPSDVCAYAPIAGKGLQNDVYFATWGEHLDNCSVKDAFAGLILESMSEVLD